MIIPQNGMKYRVVHRLEGQRYDRVSVLVFLQASTARMSAQPSWIFSARPVAGTTELPLSSIKSIEQVPPETPISVNGRAR